MGDIKLKVTFCIRQHIPCHSMVVAYYTIFYIQEAMNRASDETTKKLGQILLSFWYIFDFHNNMAAIQKGMPSMHIIPGIISFSFRSYSFPYRQCDIVISLAYTLTGWNLIAGLAKSCILQHSFKVYASVG